MLLINFESKGCTDWNLSRIKKIWFNNNIFKKSQKSKTRYSSVDLEEVASGSLYHVLNLFKKYSIKILIFQYSLFKNNKFYLLLMLI
jgi:hypothetical protein